MGGTGQGRVRNWSADSPACTHPNGTKTRLWRGRPPHTKPSSEEWNWYERILMRYGLLLCWIWKIIKGSPRNGHRSIEELRELRYLKYNHYHRRHENSEVWLFTPIEARLNVTIISDAQSTEYNTRNNCQLLIQTNYLCDNTNTSAGVQDALKAGGSIEPEFPKIQPYTPYIWREREKLTCKCKEQKREIQPGWSQSGCWWRHCCAAQHNLLRRCLNRSQWPTISKPQSQEELRFERYWYAHFGILEDVAFDQHLSAHSAVDTACGDVVEY